MHNDYLNVQTDLKQGRAAKQGRCTRPASLCVSCVSIIIRTRQEVMPLQITKPSVKFFNPYHQQFQHGECVSF